MKHNIRMCSRLYSRIMLEISIITRSRAEATIFELLLL
jgi:hypothetical protein